MKILPYIAAEEIIKNHEQFRSLFGQNKSYPSEFKIPVLAALSYFPELKSKKIHVVIRQSAIAFASRPSLFCKAENRTYLIILSSKSPMVPSELLFQQLSLNQQVGVLGHELSHTVYYLNKSGLDLIMTGIKYLFPSFRIRFEKNTDLETIRRGLGHQLLDFARYWSEHPKASLKLKNWHKKYYLHPGDIEAQMKALPTYRDVEKARMYKF